MYADEYSVFVGNLNQTTWSRKGKVGVKLLRNGSLITYTCAFNKNCIGLDREPHFVILAFPRFFSLTYILFSQAVQLCSYKNKIKKKI